MIKIYFLGALMMGILVSQAIGQPPASEKYVGDKLNVTGQNDLFTDVLVRTFNHSRIYTVGNPYLFNYWFMGDVELENGNVYTGLKLKYDALSDELLYKSPKNQDSSIVGKTFVKKFALVNTFKDSTYHFIRMTHQEEKNVNRDFFFLLYADGEASLLSRKKKSLIKASEQSGAYKTGNPFDELVEEEIFYLKKKDGTLIVFKPKEKTVLELLNDKAESLRNFIKLKKIRCKNPYELAELIRFYNQLK